MAVPIIPALIPTSEQELVLATSIMRFSHELHVDVVDGDFVAHSSWPYSPLGIPKAVKTHTDAFTLEVDLMVRNPLPAAQQWIEAGADLLVFHCETISLEHFIDFTTQAPCTVGISFHGETIVAEVLPYLEHADYVQIMGIKQIGAQGQPFDEAVFEKIATIKNEFPELLISVDGSVNDKTISRLVTAGVDRLIVGSAITKAENPAQAYRHLCTCRVV